MTILEGLSEASSFTPATTEEYFALQLARRLRDEENLRWYLRQVEHHTKEHLLSTMQRARAGPAAARAERFRSLLS
jgi:hypothetical protein